MCDSICIDLIYEDLFLFSLANRLVGGLASENVRWAESVEAFKESAKTLPGDVLLTTAFVSYVGCFIKRYRVDLMDNQWLPFLSKLKVSCSSNIIMAKIV